ncbi:iron ABC transporter substrate-binding protein [Iodidimonas muriae]|uniref:Iron ABC transporter substrate-binding protein n=1 Tax=Iodidimonas muriae TaxID=261467 RepID=A0ABQ2LFK5_9PROT|nr:iron ABC transporter substrate-binding protein [Kordiimonadales bacterium JCM 17843]GGO14064.1 iron ABC transporter substrate-binding protein [Iodidimonas muriae]
MGLCALFLGGGISAAADPTRIVSLDYCADAYVLALAEPDHILALSADAARPYAWGRERMAGIAQHDGSAEAILDLKPDLVIHSGLGHLKSVHMLDRFGIEIIDIGYSQSLDHGRKALLKVGAALGEDKKARHMLASIDGRLMAAQKQVAALEKTHKRPRALYLTPSGITTGRGTYIDEVMALAGIDNQLAERGVDGWSSVGLEALAAKPPAMVITSFFQGRSGWNNAWRFSHHPLAKRIMDRARRVEVPANQWGCGGFFLVEAVETLIAARIHDEGPQLAETAFIKGAGK